MIMFDRVNRGMGFYISATAKDPKGIMNQWLDYMFTTKGGTLLSFGIEGKTFSYNTNGLPVIYADPAKLGGVIATESRFSG